MKKLMVLVLAAVAAVAGNKPPAPAPYIEKSYITNTNAAYIQIVQVFADFDVTFVNKDACVVVFMQRVRIAGGGTVLIHWKVSCKADPDDASRVDITMWPWQVDGNTNVNITRFDRPSQLFAARALNGFWEIMDMAFPGGVGRH